MKMMPGMIQEWLIAVALIIVLPTTIWLGVKVVSHKINYREFYQQQAEFMKGYNRTKNEDAYEKRSKEWKETDTFKEHEFLHCQNVMINLAICAVASCIVIYLGCIFSMPVIAGALMMSGLILHTMYSGSNHQCPIFYNFSVSLILLFISFINLVCLLWFAYRDSASS